MKQIIIIAGLTGSIAWAASGAEPALTIYNQNFAVVRDTVSLDLQSGVNSVRYAGATARVEPDSVILRDPAGKHSLQILEQNYRNDPVSQPLLLSLFEGKTLDFETLRLKDNTQVRPWIRLRAFGGSKPKNICSRSPRKFITRNMKSPASWTRKASFTGFPADTPIALEKTTHST